MQALSPAFFTLSLVDSSCHRSWLGMGCWLQSDDFFHLVFRAQGSWGRHLLLAPPPPPSLCLDLSIRKSPTDWLSSCHFVFSGQTKNPRSQITADCFPKKQNSAVFPAFSLLYLWFKHNSIWPYQVFSWFLVNQQNHWCQCLLKTFVHEEVILQIIAWSCFLTASHSFTSFKPLSYKRIALFLCWLLKSISNLK